MKALFISQFFGSYAFPLQILYTVQKLCTLQLSNLPTTIVINSSPHFKTLSNFYIHITSLKPGINISQLQTVCVDILTIRQFVYIHLFIHMCTSE